MTRIHFFFLLAVLFVLGMAFEGAATPADSLRDPVRQQIRTRIEAERRGLSALDVRGEGVHTGPSVAQFYRDGDFEPVWIGERGPVAAVDRLLAVLQRADRDGLSPANYHTQAIEDLRMRSRRADALATGILTDLELLCTDAFLLYAAHLLSGFTSAAEIEPTWNVPQRRTDLLQLLTEAARSGSVGAAFASVRPLQPAYEALVRALRQYRSIATDGGWPTVPDGPTLERGSTGERVVLLRQRLVASGDAPAAAPAPDSVSVEFDGPLHKAVVAFQERHGLDTDGVVGPATLAALNVPVEERVQQLIVNLERRRWMPADLGDRHLLVNLAASHLRLVENGTDTLSMRVVIGRPYRQTPVFSGEISYLVLNPYWHVPHSIATKDKLPKIQEDLNYLQEQKFEVFQGWGADAQLIDPSTIDWSTLSRSNFPYRLRQESGPFNALGRVKFMFPNPHSVYLHDTPTRGHFARAERAFSSGCVRVERPIELAEYLLSDQPQWSPQRIRSMLEKTSTEQTVPLQQRVPVHLQYWTAWSEADGTTHFRKDVYRRDDALRTALAASPSPE